MEQDMVMFKQQIEEDIALIQKDLLYIDSNLSKEAYAFNYWVLSRIFGIEEELIPELITEYSDKAIDCFVHYEDSKELYIIQNRMNYRIFLTRQRMMQNIRYFFISLQRLKKKALI